MRNTKKLFKYISLIIVFATILVAGKTARGFLGNPSVSEGDSVRCDDGTGMIYRYTGGQLRYYPSPAIAQSWNPQWAANIKTLTVEECQGIPKGDPMAANDMPTTGCRQGYDQISGACLKKCAEGDKNLGMLCRTKCRDGYEDVSGVCWKGCGGDKTVGALCRQRCRSGYKEVTGVCWKGLKSYVPKTYAKDSYVPKTYAKDIYLLPAPAAVATTTPNESEEKLPSSATMPEPSSAFEEDGSNSNTDTVEGEEAVQGPTPIAIGGAVIVGILLLSLLRAAPKAAV